jgi:hypothetical protein
MTRAGRSIFFKSGVKSHVQRVSFQRQQFEVITPVVKADPGTAMQKHDRVHGVTGESIEQRHSLVRANGSLSNRTPADASFVFMGRIPNKKRPPSERPFL